MRPSSGRARRVPAGALLLVLVLSGAACDLMSEDEAAPAPEIEITGPCDAPERWSGVSPLVEDPKGTITSISAISDGAALADSTMLYVRVGITPGTTVERLLIDTDGDRLSGMWTLQSHLSGSGWNYLVDPNAGLVRHSGAPTEWNYEPVPVEGLGLEVSDDAYIFCIPLEGLGKRPPESVALAAENAHASLPARFIAGALYPPADASRGPEPIQAPGRLAFNYSAAPWIVRDCTGREATAKTISCAAKVYENFDQVVLDTDFSTHFAGGMKRLVTEIRRRKLSIEVWGYVSIVGSTKQPDGTRATEFSVAEILETARRFREAGMTGIFLDEYDVCDPAYETCQLGPDGRGIKVSRKRQIEVVEGLHEMGLAVFANGHSVMDALGELGGLPAPLGPGDGDRSADQYLLENPTLVHGELAGGTDLEGATARFAQAIDLHQRTGVRLAVLDSLVGAISDDALSDPVVSLAWWRAAQAGAAVYALGNGGPELNGGNLPVLGVPPAAAGGYGDSFDTTPVRVLDGGRIMERSVLDCTGAPIGAVRVALTAGGGTAGFIPSGAASSGC